MIKIFCYLVVCIFLSCKHHVHGFSTTKTLLKAKTSTISQFALSGTQAIKPSVGISGTRRGIAVSLPAMDSIKNTLKVSVEPLVQAFSQVKLSMRGMLLIFAGLLTALKLKVQNQVQTTAETMESGWTKRGYGGGLARTIEVWTFAVWYIIKYVRIYTYSAIAPFYRELHMAFLCINHCYLMCSAVQFRVKQLQKKDPAEYSKQLSSIAKILTNKILVLGPTFIKLGQLLSTRIDVLPREFIDELVTLQDQVPGFSGDIAVKLIEKELGKPIEQIYDSFNRTSLAAASLGQVHVAYLNGRKLAVKVQRQGLKELFDMDLKNIKVLAKIFDKFDPKTDGAQRDWLSIYDESAKLLYREIDYRAEALNCIRFQENFKDVPWVKVPDVSQRDIPCRLLYLPTRLFGKESTM